MPSASQTDWTNTLAGVQLEVRQGGARSATYTLDGASFLIGSVPGCDLRVAGDAPAALCLFGRHPTGASVRKLAPTHVILVNGQAVSERELADGDRVQIGMLDILVRVAPAAAASSTGLDRTREENEAVAQFRAQLTLFEHEKSDFDRQKRQATLSADSSAWEPQRAQLQKELREHKELLEERALEIEHQQRELVKVRQEMADLRRQLHDHHQERHDRLAGMQEDLEKTKRDIGERANKLRLDEQDSADGRQRDRARQEEFDRCTVEFTQRSLRFEDERKLFEQRQTNLLDDWTKKNAELEARANVVAEEARTLAVRMKQYEADVLRHSRREGELEKRAAELEKRAAELEKRAAELEKQSEDWTLKQETLQRDSVDFEEQLRQIDDWRAKLTDEAEQLAQQKQKQDQLTRQLIERTAALEGHQASLAVLRGRLERMREQTRTREQQLDEQHAAQEAVGAELTRKQQEFEKRLAEMQNDQQQYAQDRMQWLERSAVMETAVRQLKVVRENLAAEQERLASGVQANEERSRQLVEADGVLQGRLAQLAETQQRLDLERQSLSDRGVHLLQREGACQTLQEQLHSRTVEIAARHKQISEGLQDFQAKRAELDERQKQLDQHEQDMKHQAETLRQELEQKGRLLQMQNAQVAGASDSHQEQMKHLAIQRQTYAEERAEFQLEQQAALEKLMQARAELEMTRHDALAMIEQLPDAELRAGAAVGRLSHAREQLRKHLDEIHQYVRQCQDELAQLRVRLQADLDKLVGQEETLRRNQDEHRLAAVAFRQQLIDWQGQFGDLQRLLARDESRLDRREAQAAERARAMEAESQRLAHQAEELQEQERDVADRREEMDSHLVDMREWYRRKLRELAGIPLVPDYLNSDAEPTILPVDTSLPAPAGRGTGAEGAADDGDAERDAIVPTGRSILSIAAAGDPGDRQLGQVLRASQLIDADTLTALLAEARRQRRSLRQVLLASGVITLYQLALIEAGNVDGLMLGPVRVIDRLRNTAHEAVFRVFDPRRGAEAVLRHLAEADMADALKPDEFRQRFTQAKLNDPHVANTLEVLELSGRPAVVQEWLSGLPASDWPPLAAAPGVCYRLLTQAAQGLAAAHQAGAIHGHLSDALLFLTGEGVLKICGLGEPPWLIGLQHDEEPTVCDDLRALGKIASGWCTPTGVRKGAKTKPLPEALVSVLYRLAAEGDAGYADVKELLEDLEKAAAAIPPNAEAWGRLVKYVREHGTAEALLRQSA